MELTTSLETERHMAKELAAKLSEMGVELEESKQLVSGCRLERSLGQTSIFTWDKHVQDRTD